MQTRTALIKKNYLRMCSHITLKTNGLISKAVHNLLVKGSHEWFQGSADLAKHASNLKQLSYVIGEHAL